ncbi:MAG: sulfite exporter TauE/SafE family protein, partial [Chitinispirillales bacterium]|nr:sulfite exporter TauE/SafE family protein [Chitinispirillales bacterium]
MEPQIKTEKLRIGVSAGRTIGILIIIAALYMVLQYFGILNRLTPGMLAEANMGYGLIFIIGIMTSVHCIAMCGGINLSQSIPQNKDDGNKGFFSMIRPALFYNLGRVISYTVIGFIVGAIGSAITFSNTAQGVLKLIAGVFMIIMGINMLGILPWLRKFNLTMPKIFASKIDVAKYHGKGPIAVGLLNGFMPCGPLQAMQIYALSTGNPVTGALSMMLFSVGTVPLMFGLGAFSSVAGKRFSRKIMTVGAALVVVLGLSMLSQGWNLSGGAGKLFAAAPETVDNTPPKFGITLGDEIQVVKSTLLPWNYPAITIQAGKPVKWIIDAPRGSINGCNYKFIINEYGIEHEFKEGENVIQFTPGRTGVVRYSCWMGMIPGTITVAANG